MSSEGLRRRWTTNEIVVFPTAILGERLSGTALRLWIALAQFANDERQCWPSRRTLVQMMPDGTARGTLRRARVELERERLLEVEYRKDPATGRETSPLYTLLIPLGEGTEIVPPVGVEMVPPEGDEMVPPMNLTNELDQIEPNGDRPPRNKNERLTRKVFDTWVEATGREPKRTRLDQKRRRVIVAALKTHLLEDVLDAVTGWKHDPFYRGENDRGKTYNDLGLLLRDAEHIERFRDLARDGATGTPPPPDPRGRFFPGSGWVKDFTPGHYDDSP